MRSSPSRRRKSTGLPLQQWCEFGLIERMETRTGGTAMTSLLGHGKANAISPLLCALGHGRAEQQTSDTGCEMRLFIQTSGDEKCGSGLPVIGFMASPGSGEFARFRCESLQFNSSLARSLLRGLCDARRQARSSALLPPHHATIACRGPRIIAPCGLRFPSSMDPP